MNTSDLIKSRRLELGLTLEQVAQYVGVGKSTVRKWETGYIKNMRRDKLAKLAEILNISPIDLMDVEYSNENLSATEIPSSFNLVDEECNKTNIQWGNDTENRKYLSNKPDLLTLYNEISLREDIYLLFDKVKDLDPEDVESVLSVVQRIRNAKGLND